MERSQSYTYFQTATETDNPTTTKTFNNHNDIDTKTTTTTTTMQLRILQQKSASGGNLNSPSPSPIPQLNSNLNAIILRRKRKLLQRQQSRDYDVDIEYAADHEDEDEDLDLDIELNNSHDVSLATQHPLMDLTSQMAQRAQLSPLTLKKQFQRRKPQSSSTLLMNAISGGNSFPYTHYTSNSICDTPPTPLSNYYNDRSHRLKHEESFDSSSSTGIMSFGSPISLHRQFSMLKRDNSIHSDSSRYSSVDSLLEARKPDPEAILINLGFGPVGSEDILSRIPKRFLKPSQVRGNDTEAFVRRLQLASSLADHSVLGYRGLTGNPDVPPSSIVAKIMHRFEVNERKKSMASIEHTIQ